ncbi:MAG: hypothetical protein IT353_06155 [Gemmatimonadaceae bacterium]|nr:hypothetical protein [Gemmatimonadaceae bacterium]
MTKRQREHDAPRPVVSSYTVLHAGTAIGTISIAGIDDTRGMGELIPSVPMSAVARRLLRAWEEIEQLADLPTYKSGAGALSSQTAKAARLRIATVASEITVVDRTGREIRPLRCEYVHASGSPSLLFELTFESDGPLLGARTTAPPTSAHPGGRHPE